MWQSGMTAVTGIFKTPRPTTLTLELLLGDMRTGELRSGLLYDIES